MKKTENKLKKEAGVGPFLKNTVSRYGLQYFLSMARIEIRSIEGTYNVARNERRGRVSGNNIGGS